MKKNNFKYLMLAILTLFCLNSVFAVHEQQLVWYNMEEGSGDLFLDLSGNSNHAITNDITYSSTTKRWDTYSSYFDGNDDYGSLIQGGEFPDKFSVSIWLNPDFLNTDPKCVFCVKDTNEQHSFRFLPATDNMAYVYQVENGTSYTHILENFTFVDGTWYHLVLGVDTTTNEVKYWRDGSLISDSLTANNINHNNATKIIYIGTDNTLTYDYRGYMDGYRYFDFVLDNEQVEDLFFANEIILQHADEFEASEMFEYIKPLHNTTHTNPVEFEVKLKLLASCDFYNNNEYITTFSDLTSFKFDAILDEGNNTFYFYCYGVCNQTEITEFSTERTIEVIVENPNQINFKIVGNDFDVEDESLYITTPCMNEGIKVPLVDWTAYQPEFNSKGINFAKVDKNGLASLNVSSEINEYCLYNGRIIINEEGKTTDYDVVELNGILELGNIKTPSNITINQVVYVDLFDIYNKTNPKAWGQTWTTIIASVIGIILGVIILIAGLYANNGRIVVAGVLITMASLGFSMGGIITLINL